MFNCASSELMSCARNKHAGDRTLLRGCEVIEQRNQRHTQLFAMDDLVNKAMFLKEFGRLEPSWKFLLGCFLYYTGTGEADHAFWFGQNDIPERCEAGHNTGGGRMSEHRDIRQSGLSMPGESSAGFGHLHEAEHALIHPSAARSRNNNHGFSVPCASLDQPSYFLADDRAHRRREKTEVHYGNFDGPVFKLSRAGQDRILHTGFLLVAFESIAVTCDSFEIQHVD